MSQVQLLGLAPEAIKKFDFIHCSHCKGGVRGLGTRLVLTAASTMYVCRKISKVHEKGITKSKRLTNMKATIVRLRLAAFLEVQEIALLLVSIRHCNTAATEQRSLQMRTSSSL